MAARLQNEDVERYSRQLIMPELGVPGQLKLKSAKALIVGAGGLGCPCAQYLVASGVGTVGILDYDVVERSNLHRQILHSEESVARGISKSESAYLSLRSLNSSCNIKAIATELTRDNAVHIFCDYDLVIDATDNVASRYLISDVCVLTGKPLVSGSALRWEGQLTTYHFMTKSGEIGPCYRCLYPTPPPAESVTNCSDGGVIGVIPGIIGCMQALEAIKILSGNQPSFHQKLFIFDGFSAKNHTVKLRPRQTSCICCGNNPTISIEKLPNYSEFCGMEASDKCKILSILGTNERISVKHYYDICLQSINHVLVDVRHPIELDICSLPGSLNVPISVLQTASMKSQLGMDLQAIVEKFAKIASLKALVEKRLLGSENCEYPVPIYIICRMGNDSQIAVKILKRLFGSDLPIEFKDIKGGLMAWATQIDTDMPKY